jgi:hypothetical protein
MATTYNFTDGTLTRASTPSQKNYIPVPFEVRRNTVNFALATLDVSASDVAQALYIPANTTVLSAFIRVITAETADATCSLGYGSDPAYWGKNLNLDVTGIVPTILYATATYDAASCPSYTAASGASHVSVDVTVAGASLGDITNASLAVDVVDLVLSSTVTAEDTVTVVLANPTGAAIDLASTTLRVTVIKAPRLFTPLYFATADTIDITGSATNGDVDIDAAKVEVIAICINHAK